MIKPFVRADFVEKKTKVKIIPIAEIIVKINVNRTMLPDFCIGRL